MNSVEFSGGGVVVYSQTATGVYVLLGQEHEEEGFRDSNMWSAFEGGKKEEDRTCLDTCIRELFEESLGIFGDDCRKICNNNQHTLKVDMRLRDRRRTRQRILYIINVPYKNYSTLFQARRTALLRLHEACERYHSCNTTYVLRCGMIVENDTQPRHTIQKITDVSYSDGMLKVKYECALGQAVLIAEATPKVAECQSASFEEYKNICTLAMQVDPDLLRGAFCEQKARVNVDYLEKSNIKYFSLNELQEANDLRVIFAPVAKLLCSRLKPANLTPSSTK